MKTTSLTITNPAALFSQFSERSQSELLKIRKIIKNDNDYLSKSPRTWGIKEAALMIGRSMPWLRENDKDVPRNRQNHGRWTLPRINQLRDQVKTRVRRPSTAQVTIMACVNFKGGVGKTTTAAHLAQKAAINGLRVLAVDLDPQATLTFLLGGLIPEVDVNEDDLINPYLLDSTDNFASVIRETYFAGVDIIPTSLPLQDLDLALPNPELNNRQTMGSAVLRLRNALALVQNDYDLIILDCPPNMGSITANALAAANALLIPLPPAAADRASFMMFCQSLSLFYGHLNRDLDYMRILISKHDGSAAHKFNEGRIRALYGEYVMTHVLTDSTEIEKAASYMRTVYELEKPLNSRETYQRSLDSLDNCCGEVLDDIQQLWGLTHER
jgi:chromosome partitioning protein